MDPDDILKIVMGNSAEFIRQIRTGAAWELPAHVLITQALNGTPGVNVVREIRYPGSGQSVDIAFTVNNILYLIELKVESAVNNGQFAGKSLQAAFNEDRNKLSNFDTGAYLANTALTPGRKWVIIIAYSGFAKNRMKTSGFFSRLYESGPIMAGISDA